MFRREWVNHNDTQILQINDSGGFLVAEIAKTNSDYRMNAELVSKLPDFIALILELKEMAEEDGLTKYVDKIEDLFDGEEMTQ